jgi:hypothetical protein
MIRSYARGLGAATARWPLALMLWFVGMAFAAAFGWAISFWLVHALDGSLATRTLVNDLDPNVFVDLYFHHWEGLRMLLPIAVVLAIVYVILWAWLHGVVVHAVRSREAALTESFWRGLSLSPVYLRLLVVATLFLAVFSFAIGWGAWSARNYAAEGSTALIADLAIAAGVAAWWIGYVFLTAVHDHARIRAAATGEGALAAYGWAWSFVARGGERAFLFALLLQASALVLWGAFELVTLRGSVAALLGVAWSFVWGELFLLARMWMRLWFFAAQSELQ